MSTRWVQRSQNEPISHDGDNQRQQENRVKGANDPRSPPFSEQVDQYRDPPEKQRKNRNPRQNADPASFSKWQTSARASNFCLHQTCQHPNTPRQKEKQKKAPIHG